MATNPSVEVTYTLSPETYRASMLAQIESPVYQAFIRQGRRKAAVHSAILFPIYVLASVGMFWVIDPSGFTLEETMTLAILLGVMAGIIAFLFNTSKSRFIDHHRRQLQRSATEQSWPGFLGKCRLVIDESGIRYQCRGQDSHYPWRCVIDVDAYDTGLTVMLSSGRAVMLGNSIIDSGQSVKEIVQVISAYWSKDKAIAALARDYLGEHELKCPQCSYLIHGVSTNACPECSRQIGIEDLKRAVSPAKSHTPTPDSSSTRSA